MNLAKTGYRNLLEPPEMAELFLRFPPKDFRCVKSASGLPLFQTDFDLLTTLESDMRARLARAPLYGTWSRLLRLDACFAGTTVTEYAPLPRGARTEELLDELAAERCNIHSLTILKDLPDASPLLSDEDNAFSSRLMQEAEQRGFLCLEGQALAYVPIDFSSLDEYLARLSASRRKDLRRKMKARAKVTIDLMPLGDKRFSQKSLLDEFYAMYLEVYEQSEVHFDLLSPAFFAALLQSGSVEGVAFCYRHGERLAGYNICLLHNDMLVDKYIGFTYPLARELNLYFTSWMANLEFALENRLTCYVAGWTDPEVKAGLGASFTFTRHLAWIKNPLLRRVLSPLRSLFESDARTLEGRQ